jgi:hypothetical protein
MSTVYSEPAVRTVSDPASQERMLELHKLLRLDEQMPHGNRLVNLHRVLLAFVWVKMAPNGDRTPQLDWYTPANFRVVLHPNDGKSVVGWILRLDLRPRMRSTNTPAWVLWTDHEKVFLRSDFSPIGDSYVEHELGVCPCIPITLGPPCPGFWPGEEGEDMVAAHTAIWMSNVLMLKETKSATKVNVVAGDTHGATQNQPMDTDTQVNVPEGTSWTSVDTSMDLALFRDTADHVLGSAGNNYGMPPAVMSHQGTQSAEARELLRIPIREMRNQQRIPFRMFERELAVALAAVMRVDLPQHAFDPDGFAVRFGEGATPLTTKEALDIFQTENRLGLNNLVEYTMERNRDLTWEQAVDRIATNIAVNYQIQLMLRPTMAINGALGQVQANAQTPQQNGATGQQVAGASQAGAADAEDALRNAPGHPVQIPGGDELAAS